MKGYELIMKEYENYLWEGGQNEATIARTLKQVRHFIKWLSIKEIRPEAGTYDLTIAYLGDCRHRGVSELTLRNYLQWLRSYYDFLVANETLKSNPIKHLKLRQRSQSIRGENLLMEILKAEELETIFMIYKSNKRLLLRNKILLGLSVFQGLASGEEVKIKVKDIDLNNGEINLPGNSRYKSRKLELDARQVLDLNRCMANKRATDYLIEYNSSYHAANARLNLITQLNIELGRKKSPLQVANLAQLRRSVIVNWLKTHSLRQVQYMAGHHWVSATERYRRGQIEDLQQAIEKYHPLNDA